VACASSAPPRPRRRGAAPGQPAKLTFGERDGGAVSARARFAAACAQAHLDHLASEHIGQEQWIKYTFLTALAAAPACCARTSAPSSPPMMARRSCAACTTNAWPWPKAAEPIPEAAQDTARGTLTQAGSALKASMLRDLEAGQQVEAEQIVGDMLARAQGRPGSPAAAGRLQQPAGLPGTARRVSLVAASALPSRVLILGWAGADACWPDICRRVGVHVAARCATRVGAGRWPARHPLRADATPSPALLDEIAQAEAVLCSVPPDAEGDPALRLLLPALRASPALRWVGYLSSTSVYADRAGGWVDERSAADATEAAGVQRLRAEAQWRALAEERGIASAVFRLPGLYGPGAMRCCSWRRDVPAT
jgi:hypothetical protein